MRSYLISILFSFFFIPNAFCEYIVFDWTTEVYSISERLYRSLFQYAQAKEGKPEANSIILEEGSVIVLNNPNMDSYIICESKRLANGQQAFRTIFDLEMDAFKESETPGSLAHVLFEAVKESMRPEDLINEGENIAIVLRGKKEILQLNAIEIDDDVSTKTFFRFKVELKRGLQELVGIVNRRVIEAPVSDPQEVLPTTREIEIMSKTLASQYVECVRWKGLAPRSMNELRTLFIETAMAQGFSEETAKILLKGDFFNQIRKHLGGVRYSIPKITHLIEFQLRQILLFRKG